MSGRPKAERWQPTRPDRTRTGRESHLTIAYRLGREAFFAGKPCEAPWRYSKGFNNQRIGSWLAGWRAAEADAKYRGATK